MDIESANEPVKEIWLKATVDYVDDWFLMPSPVPILSIWIVYMLFILKLGPEFMKNRPAYNLSTLILIYNCIQVVLSFYMFVYSLDCLKPMNYIFLKCITEEETKKVIHFSHLVLISKLIDYFDTIFFVLRKKYNQVSFLHVYHHTVAVFTSWLVIKLEPHPVMLFLVVVNSFIHVIMYGYYALSTFPAMRKYLWWKKYITSLQLVQFVIVMSHYIINAFIGECIPSYILISLMFINQCSMLVLFTKFYFDTYKIPKTHKDKPKEDDTFNDSNYVNSISKSTNSYSSVKHRSS